MSRSPEEPSKSERKRQHLALQQLAGRLVEMPRAELADLDLSAATWAALDEIARIRDRRARARQVKRIANLLEREDQHAVHLLVDERVERQRVAAAQQQEVERWRARLLDKGDSALAELLERCPGADRQRLRQLLRAARRDSEAGRSDGPRQLFRCLRDLLEEARRSSLTGEGR